MKNTDDRTVTIVCPTSGQVIASFTMNLSAYAVLMSQDDGWFNATRFNPNGFLIGGYDYSMLSKYPPTKHNVPYYRNARIDNLYKLAMNSLPLSDYIVVVTA